MSKKGILILSCSVVVIATAASLAYYLWPVNVPDPQTQSPKEITEYLSSDEFTSLSEKKKQGYWKATTQRVGNDRGAIFRSRDTMSEQQRRKLFENVRPMFMKMMADRVDRYFALPPEEQVAYLDKMIEMIDQMRGRRATVEQRRRQGEPATPAKEGGSDGRAHRGRRRLTPDRLKKILENTPPQQRAKFIEFHKAIRRRMEARGISSRHGPPGR